MLISKEKFKIRSIEYIFKIIILSNSLMDYLNLKILFLFIYTTKQILFFKLFILKRYYD